MLNTGAVEDLEGRNDPTAKSRGALRNVVKNAMLGDLDIYRHRVIYVWLGQILQGERHSDLIIVFSIHTNSVFVLG